MKTILISLPFGMSARNILRSAAYEILKKEARVVIVSPLSSNAAFREEFASPQTVFASLSPARSFLRKLLERVFVPGQLWRFTADHPTGTLTLLRRKLLRSKPVAYALYALLGKTLGDRPFLFKLYRGSLRNSAAGRILDENKVDLVFTTHGYVETDVELAAEAQARGIPVVNMIHSWDNVSSKSGLTQITNMMLGRLLLVDLYQHILVWNDVLKEELREMYGVADEKITVVGIPQFDSYSTLKNRVDRESFLKSFNANPNKKLILYCAGSPVLVHDQTAIVKNLVEAVRGGKLSKPAQLLIRSHPGAMQNWRNDFSGPDVFFQTPTNADKAMAVDGWDKRVETDSEIAKSIANCDVLVHCISTVAIEGAIFDRPTLGVGYDGDASHSDAVRRAYEETTHYSKLMSTGGSRVAVSAEDMIKQIDAYLVSPERDKEGREKTRSQQCFQVDGKSGERIGRFLVELLRK